MNTDVPASVDLGSWIGRSQAFAAVANHCSYAQAKCLKEVHDHQLYRRLDLTWDEFCSRYAGLSRPRVDALIRGLEEFGETYFRFSEIVRVTPEGFRHIAPRIDGSEIEIDGEKVAIAPENADRIRAAVSRLRADLALTRERVTIMSKPTITELQNGVDKFCERLLTLAKITAPCDLVPVRCLVTYAERALVKVRRALPPAPDLPVLKL